MPIKAISSKDRVAVHLGISGNPTMATLIWSVRALGLILLTNAIVSGLPAIDDSRISVDDHDENSTLATDLVPPALEPVEERNVSLYIINLYAVSNHSGESSEEALDNTLKEKMPEIIGPLATIFLVVEDGGDEEPVNLDEMAEFMEKHGFKMDKIEESGETSVLRTEVPVQELDDVKDMLESSADNSLSQKPHKSKKYRVRRMACHKCHHGGGGGYGGGGYGKGGGGGGYGGGTYQYYPSNGGGTIGVIPVYVVPVSIQTQPQYHPQPTYHQPSGGGCNSCQGGGNRGGGGGAWATASASAQAGAGSW